MEGGVQLTANEPNLAEPTAHDSALKSEDRLANRVNASTAESQERAVGITAFASPEVPGFTCTIKHRYTDFLVNEILPNGGVVHLTETAFSGQKKRSDQSGNVNHDGPVDSRETLLVSSAEIRSNETTATKRKPGDCEDHPLEGAQSRSKRLKTAQEGQSHIETDNANGVNEMIEMVNDNNDTSSRPSKEVNEDHVSELPEADRSELQSIFGEQTTALIFKLHASVLRHPDRKPREHPTIKSEVIAEKSKRTQAHVAVRRIFASKLETATMQDLPGVISVKAAPTKGPSGARGQPYADPKAAFQKGKLGWDELGGEYLHFTLYKENKDTMEVLFHIAAQLKVPAKNFQFAGTKDRRGVTVQRVAIFRVHANRIAGLNKGARGWRVGNFEYQKHGLDLGELNGNEFLLTLRDCHFDGEEAMVHEEKLALANELVGTATGSFQQHGFLNYYGMQRFGTYSTGTHMTGQKMLKGDLEGAIDSILAYPDDMLPENVDTSGTGKVPQDDINRADAIRTWRKEGVANEAVNKMPRRFQAEMAIMQYLGKKDRKSGRLLQATDWQGALMQIQRNLRLMYVHAYQSLVWNTVAGKRWEMYGNKVIEGDLVIFGEKDGGVHLPRNEVDEDGEPIFHPAADDSAPSAEDAHTRARHLTQKEAESGKYDVFDIVLPLPGFDVEYPANEIRKFYEDFMASEAGGEMDPHNMRRSWKDISLSGSYRKMMARPGKDFAFEVKSYVGDDEQLVETDLDKVKKQTKTKSDNIEATAGADDRIKPIEGESLQARAESGSVENALKTETKIELAGGDCPQPEDEKIAIVLKLQLGSSQYATMALRELAKGGAANFKPEYSAR